MWRISFLFRDLKIWPRGAAFDVFRWYAPYQSPVMSHDQYSDCNNYVKFVCNISIFTIKIQRKKILFISVTSVSFLVRVTFFCADILWDIIYFLAKFELLFCKRMEKNGRFKVSVSSFNDRQYYLIAQYYRN